MRRFTPGQLTFAAALAVVLLGFAAYRTLALF
jgi:hypothetical protein